MQGVKTAFIMKSCGNMQMMLRQLKFRNFHPLWFRLFDVWRFVLQDNGIKSGFDFKHSLKGEDCLVSRDVWKNLAKNPDPPWLFPKTSIDAVDRLHLVPSFIDLTTCQKMKRNHISLGCWSRLRFIYQIFG